MESAKENGHSVMQLLQHPLDLQLEPGVVHDLAELRILGEVAVDLAAEQVEDALPPALAAAEELGGDVAGRPSRPRSC